MNKKLIWLIVIVIAQLFLLRTTFKNTLENNGSFIFCNNYDGLKNYYTLHTYIQDTATHDLFHYNFMNYPYGDCVYYTDNTPLFAVAYKALCFKIPQLLNYDFKVFDTIMVLNILLASIILYFILLQFVQSPVLLIVFSICLPWCSQMFFKLTNCMNFSLSSLILLHLLLHIRLYYSWGSIKKTSLYSALIILLILLSFFIHGYYLFILAFTSAFICFLQGFVSLKMRPVIASLLIPAFGFGLSWIALNLIDPQLAQRSSNIIGYGYDAWEASTLGLLCPYPTSTIRFWVAPGDYPFSFEASCYLGAGFIIGTGILLLFWIGKCIRRRDISGTFIKSYQYLPLILLLTSFFLLMIALGEDGYMFRSQHKYYNFLNPVYYLHKLVPEFSHIRFTGRFLFAVFFIANILFAGALQMFLNKAHYKWVATLLIAVVCILMAYDTCDSIRTFYSKPNLFAKVNFEKEISLPKIDYTAYQAILPLPYYHVGSADWHHTMETDEDFFNRTLYISANTHLPLMSCKMSRTPDYQNRDLVNLFLHDEVSGNILERVNSKPILVLVDKNNCTNEGASRIVDHTFAFQASANCQSFIARIKPKLMHEDDRYAYYIWNIKQ